MAGVGSSRMDQRQHRKIQANKAELIQGWKAGKTISSMAKRLGVNPVTLTNNFRRWGLPPRKKAVKTKSIVIQQNKDNIIKAFQDGDPIKKIAKRYNIANCTVREWLNRWGYSTAVNRCKLDHVRIKQLHDAGFSPAEIARKLGTLRGTISKILIDKYGIRQSLPKYPKRVKRLTDKDIEFIRVATEEGKSQMHISRMLQVTPDTILKYQKKLGIKPELKGAAYTKTAIQLQNFWIKKLFEDNISVYKISKIIGIDKTTVKARLLKIGYKMRTSKLQQQQARRKREPYRIPKRDKEIMRMKI